MASPLFDELYSPSAGPLTAATAAVPVAVTPTKSSPKDGVKLSISKDEILLTESAAAAAMVPKNRNISDRDSGTGAEAGAGALQWKLPLTRVFVIEILTCLHSRVFLRDLGAKFLGLIIKILNCFNMHILMLADYKGSGGGVDSSVAAATPPPSASSAKSTPGGGGPSTSSTASQAVSLEDLTWTITDVHQLAHWLQQTLLPLVLAAISPQQQSPRDSGDDSRCARQAEVVKSCVEKQVHAVLRLVPILWNKLAEMLVAECKSGLKVSNIRKND